MSAFATIHDITAAVKAILAAAGFTVGFSILLASLLRRKAVSSPPTAVAAPTATVHSRNVVGPVDDNPRSPFFTNQAAPTHFAMPPACHPYQTFPVFGQPVTQRHWMSNPSRDTSVSHEPFSHASDISYRFATSPSGVYPDGFAITTEGLCIRVGGRETSPDVYQDHLGNWCAN